MKNNKDKNLRKVLNLVQHVKQRLNTLKCKFRLTDVACVSVHKQRSEVKPLKDKGNHGNGDHQQCALQRFPGMISYSYLGKLISNFWTPS